MQVLILTLKNNRLLSLIFNGCVPNMMIPSPVRKLCFCLTHCVQTATLHFTVIHLWHVYKKVWWILLSAKIHIDINPLFHTNDHIPSWKITAELKCRALSKILFVLKIFWLQSFWRKSKSITFQQRKNSSMVKNSTIHFWISTTLETTRYEE